MQQNISNKQIVVIGLMLFALFFGAGNLVFPIMLGQTAGTEVWSANLGFLLTGVGLPLLGVIAFSFSGERDLLNLTKRVHPIFGLVFTTTLYLTIGPLFAMPRTGSVSYEIGIRPFVEPSSNQMVMLVFSILYFGLVCLVSLYPSKMIDIVGKYLTPLLLAFIAILSIAALVKPLGELQAPQKGYEANALFHGFQEGYLTMDALAALVFGIIVINAIKERGVQSRKHLLFTGVKASLLAAAILAILYSVLSYIGAISVEELGYMSNGGEILAQLSQHYFGTLGGVLLGIIVLLACLTTSIGLTTACSNYFHQLMPRISYRSFAIIFSIISALLANVGLNELIHISVPVLTAIYPLAIVLILLTFLHPLFKGKREVYWYSLTLTFLVSAVEGINESSLKLIWLEELYDAYVPLYSVGLGWLIPACVGAVIGLLASSAKRTSSSPPITK